MNRLFDWIISFIIIFNLHLIEIYICSRTFSIHASMPPSRSTIKNINHEIAPTPIPKRFLFNIQTIHRRQRTSIFYNFFRYSACHTTKSAARQCSFRNSPEAIIPRANDTNVHRTRTNTIYTL